MRAEQGQSLVEFAITLPLVALLLFAIIQYGLIFGSQISLRNASAVAARYAILSNPTPSATQVEDVARNALGPLLSSSNLKALEVDLNASVGGVTGAKKVNLTYDVPLIVAFAVPGSKGNKLTISAETIMR